ncbi:MAG: TonB-dependent receptor [Sphingobium sp.]|nr:TonB-dependent receptor [Sphingobium sp.]
MRSSSWMLAGAALIAINSPVVAQVGGPQNTAPTGKSETTHGEDSNGGQDDPIIVSGSRIDRAGFIAPSPTVVIGSELLKDRAAVNVADVINEVPSFRRTQAPEAGGIGNQGTNNADLRGLGPVRTLVLLDRMRLPAVNLPGAAVAGAPDLNLIPSALISRIDVVTGGASAAYGSGAVSGVLNLQLNTTLNGIKGNAQWGETKYGDAKDVFVSLAGGTSFAGGRGHIVIGGEYNRNDGTGLFNDLRPWGRRNVSSVSLPTNRASTLPANLITDNVVFGMLTTGGLISPTATNNPAALRNLQFVQNANGTVSTAPFIPGLYQGQIGTNMVGGSGTPPYQVLRAKTERYSLALNAEYDLTDDIQLWVRDLYSNVKTENISAQIRAATGGTTGLLSISRNNPYLQAALTSDQLGLIPANGSLTIGYLGNDFGPPVIYTESKTWSVAGGLRGKFASNWRWDVGIQYSRNSAVQDQTNTAITNNFLNAINVISIGGQNVCAVQAARDAGCQPINILGKASYSPGAYAYAFGTAHSEAISTLFEASANLNGEVLTLPAGAVSIGIGGEYREESFLTNADAISQAGLFMARAPRNFPKASYSVKEGYIETIVPLFKPEWVTGSLEFNGALRLTDYSISGSVTTWKAGLVWKPVPDLMLRGTVSRDIRAPSLTELFTSAVATVPKPLYTDPRAAFAGQPAYTYDTITGGNVNLKPEVAKTISFGGVLNPRFLSRLQLSADYFFIRVEDAIGATGAATSLTNCIGNGASTLDPTSPYCGLITFANNNPTSGAVLSVLSQNANFAEFKTRGLDFALSYSQPLSEIIPSAKGRLVLSTQATHVLEYRSTFDVSRQFPNGVNRAGQTGAIFGGTAGVPDWVVNANLAYRGGRMEGSVQYRWISKSHFNNSFVGPDDASYSPTLTNSISDNIVPSRGYVNLSLSYNLGTERKKIQLYGTVNNLFDQDPPLPAINNNAWYDLLGQSFRLGIRFDL